MSKSFLLLAIGALLTVGGCGEHQPVENDDPRPPGVPDFGEEVFFQGPFYYDTDGIQTFLLQSDRVISVIFDSTAANTQLRQVASDFELRLFPDLTRPADVDWETEKRRTSLWVTPEGADISSYYTIFPRTDDDPTFFGWHPLVNKSFPSYADQELVVRYFIDNRFFAFTSPEISAEDLEDWNEFNGVEIRNERNVDDTVEYTMRLTADSRFATVEMANEYHQSMFFQSATPDFIVFDIDN